MEGDGGVIGWRGNKRRILHAACCSSAGGHDTRNFRRTGASAPVRRWKELAAHHPSNHRVRIGHSGAENQDSWHSDMAQRHSSEWKVDIWGKKGQGGRDDNQPRGRYFFFFSFFFILPPLPCSSSAQRKYHPILPTRPTLLSPRRRLPPD